MILEFDNLYNNFLINNFDAIYKGRKKSLVYEFREEIENKYDTIQNEYFKNYMERLEKEPPRAGDNRLPNRCSFLDSLVATSS